MKFEKPCFINSFLGGWRKVLQIWLLCCNFGFWVFWTFSLNTGICIWAFENYNLTTLNKHSVLTAPLFSPYASPAKPIKENGEAANLYACCLSSTEKSHVLLRAESILRSLACIPWEEPVQVIGMDKGETSSAHGSSGRASVYLAEGGRGVGEEKSTSAPAFSQMEVFGLNSSFFPPTTLGLIKPWNTVLLPRIRASSCSWKIMRIQRESET